MRSSRVLAMAVFCVVLGAVGWAQTPPPVTAADLQRLDVTADSIADAASALKKSDPTLAMSVERTLADLRDEVAYLKVKLRREGSVSRADYSDIHDRLETLQIKATGSPAGKVSAQPLLDQPATRTWTVPVGTELDVRLQTPLSSGTAKVEQRFEATTVTDVIMGRDVVIPAGTLIRGFVSSVRAAGRIDRTGSLTLSFDEIIVGGAHQRLRASVVQALDGKMGDDAGRVTAGAVVGGLIGGILGGGKGALLGVLVGAGGTIAATDGADVILPVGTMLRLRVDQPLDVVG